MIRPSPPSPPLPFEKSVDLTPESNGFQACNGPTTGYRDGPNGVVEVKHFKDGWIPAGWFDNPINCSHSTGGHLTTKYLKVC